MNHHSDSGSRAPILGFISLAVPIALILGMVLLYLVTNDFDASSRGFRASSIAALFALGVGTGLGIGGLARRSDSSQGRSGRLSAIAGISLSTLIFLLFTLLSLQTPVAVPPDKGLVEDLTPKQGPPRLP